MYDCASRPIFVPADTAARSMSPVEICGTPSATESRLACVPFPAPGGPNMISRAIALLLPILAHAR
jgi:hypothetical protein